MVMMFYEPLQKKEKGGMLARRYYFPFKKGKGEIECLPKFSFSPFNWQGNVCQNPVCTFSRETESAAALFVGEQERKNSFRFSVHWRREYLSFSRGLLTSNRVFVAKTVFPNRKKRGAGKMPTDIRFESNALDIGSIRSVNWLPKCESPPLRPP